MEVCMVFPKSLFGIKFYMYQNLNVYALIYW